MTDPRTYLIRQPGWPEASEADAFYTGVVDRLTETMRPLPFASNLHPALLEKVVFTLADYLQDIAADGGLWRSFVTANRSFYGWSVPFHPIPEEYVDYELNREDVRFLVWYAVAMLDESKRGLYPHDAALLDFADRAYEFLDSVYDEAPVNESWEMARGLDLDDAEDQGKVMHLAQWLFLHSYLLTPAFAQRFAAMAKKAGEAGGDTAAEIHKLLDDAMADEPTGPLALFIMEWLSLMVAGKLPADDAAARPDTPEHPYYTAFTKASGGREVMFFGSYEEMNRFFIDGMGWEAGQEHLSQAKGAHDYALLVNRSKGMLMARDVARCLKAPGNPIYDAVYARTHAFRLLTVEGACPGDLLRRAVAEGWLPDAAFPGTGDTALVRDNADFIARCYLQLYYRD